MKLYDKIGLMKQMKVDERVYGVVRGIPKGKVMSYGQVGIMVGIGPRQVGRILHNNPQPPEPHPGPPLRKGREEYFATPCHRVVRSDRTLAKGYAFGGEGEQKRRLVAEGVKWFGEKIDKSCFIR